MSYEFPKNPFDFKYIVNGYHILRLLNEQLDINCSNPFQLHSSNVYENNSKMIRLYCTNKCRAMLIYQYNSHKQIYELLSAQNTHSHKILLKNQSLMGDLHALKFGDQIFQNKLMKNNYQRYGKFMYVNVVGTKNTYMLVFSGLNANRQICLFGICIFTICSRQKVNEMIQEFAKQNRNPQTIISMSQQILQYCKKYFNSVHMYCIQEISQNLKIRHGILKLLQETFTTNEWDFDFRKILLAIYNFQQPTQLKRIFTQYKKYNYKFLPNSFIGLNIHICHKQMLFQHFQEYAYRLGLQHEQSWKIFLNNIPKLIQVQIPDQQLQQLQLILPTQINYNGVTLQLRKKYTSYAIKHILGQQNRAMVCDIFQKSSKEYLVRQKNQGQFLVCKQYSEESKKKIKFEKMVNLDIEQLFINQVLKPQNQLQSCSSKLIKANRNKDESIFIQEQQQFLKNRSNNINLWKCSCNLSAKTGLPCCHIMKLLIRNGAIAGQIEHYIDQFWINQEYLDKIQTSE